MIGANEQPVLLVVFLRADNITRQLEVLAKTNRSVYISIDGPRTQEDKKLQENVYKAIKNFILKKRNKVKVLVRKENVGIACAVVTALDWFFSEQQQGIVIEDDLDFDTDFLTFMDYSLLKFNQDSRVMMISGNNYLSLGEQEPHGWMTNFPQTWGWATWASRWRILRMSFSKSDLPNARFLFDPKYWFFWIGKIRTLNRRIDTWDIPIAYQMYTSGGLCVLPPVNLCSNVGTDSFATHTRNDEFPIRFPRERLNDKPGDELWWKNSLNEIGTMNHFIARKIFGVSSLNFLKSPVYCLEGVIYQLTRVLNSKNQNLHNLLEIRKPKNSEIVSGQGFVELMDVGKI